MSKEKAKRNKRDYNNLQDNSKHDNEHGKSKGTSTECLRPTFLCAAVLETNPPPAVTLTITSAHSQPVCNHDKQP